MTTIAPTSRLSPRRLMSSALLGLGRLTTMGASATARVKAELIPRLLTPQELETMTVAAYDTLPAYLRGAGEDVLFVWEREIIEAHFPPRGRILVTAAGSGREAFALARRGYDVIASEPNEKLREAMVARARRLGVAVEVLQTLPTTIPATTSTLDGAIIGWGAYTHIPDAGRRVEYLARLAKLLPEGAPVLLSYLPSAPLPHVPPPLARMLGGLVASGQRLGLFSRAAERGDDVDPVGRFVHHFTRDEVLGELQRAGLEMVVARDLPYPHSVALRPSR